jgi:hypothetical protein
VYANLRCVYAQLKYCRVARLKYFADLLGILTRGWCAIIDGDGAAYIKQENLTGDEQM